MKGKPGFQTVSLFIALHATIADVNRAWEFRDNFDIVLDLEHSTS